MREMFSVGTTLSGTPGVQFAGKEKCTRMQVDAHFNGLAGWPGTWKIQLETCDIEIWGRGMWIEFSENRRIFVSHGNAPQRVTSEEENF